MVQNSGSSDGISRSEVTRADWFKRLSHYEKPDTRKALWELASTLPAYFALWCLLIFLVGRGVPAVYLLPLMLVAGLLDTHLHLLPRLCPWRVLPITSGGESDRGLPNGSADVYRIRGLAACPLGAPWHGR
ncbi:MAG: hypothetical protein QM758_30290 [Armatimonas sp.]